MNKIFIDTLRSLKAQLEDTIMEERNLTYRLDKTKALKEKLMPRIEELVDGCDHKYPPKWKGLMNTKSKFTAVGMKTQQCRICERYIDLEWLS